MNGKISNFAQVASVRRYTITEGKESGLDVIDCDNGKIRFLLNLSKACDIMQLYHEGQNVSFISKNGFTNRETDFMNRFEGGMVYTCGLDSLGRRTGYEMHGTFHNIPAQIVSVKCDEQGIEVQAIIRDTALFGKNLVMKRRIFSALESENITLEDTLVNEGYKDEEYCLLYHINVGYPMLDEGGKIEAKVKEVGFSNEWARENQNTMYDIEEPLSEKKEICYYLRLEEPKISLINEKIKKKFTVEYSKETLPYFLEWKSMASGDYALGLEPCTTEIRNLQYSEIKPNEKVEFLIKIYVEKL